MIYAVSAKNNAFTHNGVKLSRLNAYLTEDQGFIKSLDSRRVWVVPANEQQMSVYLKGFWMHIEKRGGVRNLIELADKHDALTKESKEQCNKYEAQIESLCKKIDDLNEEISILKQNTCSLDSKTETGGDMPCKTKPMSKPKANAKPATKKPKGNAK